MEASNKQSVVPAAVALSAWIAVILAGPQQSDAAPHKNDSMRNRSPSVAQKGRTPARPATPSRASRTAPKRAAGSPGHKAVREYTFEDMLVDGEVLKPQILYTKVLDRAKLERLLRLRTSFLQRMLRTYRYPCLRRGW